MRKSPGAWHRRGWFLAAVVAGLILLADIFFYEQPIGWTAGLYAGLLVVAVAMRGGWRHSRAPRLIVAAATLGLAGAMVIEPTPLAVILTLVGLVMLAATAQSGWTASVVVWSKRWLLFVMHMVVQWAYDVRLLHRQQRRRGTRMPGVTTLRQWLIPLACGSVFLALFAVANPVVSRMINIGWTWVSERLQTLPEWVGPGRVLLWTGVAVGAWGLLRARLRGRDNPATTRASADAANGTFRAGVDLVVRCLLVFNLLFAVQNLLDVRYLWAGAELPAGMTYAQYAHRGAYPLVATALLSAAFVLVVFRRHGAAERSRWARWLVYLWLAQNVFLMAGAADRLALYVEAYSLTRWRVASGVWMGLVALGVLTILWRLLRGYDGRWLLQVNTVITAAVLYALCFINVDGFIASYNTRHSREVTGHGVALDVGYLRNLGVEALPALQWFAEEVGPEHPEQARAAIGAAYILERDLDRSLHNWRGWSVRRAGLQRQMQNALSATHRAQRS